MRGHVCIRWRGLGCLRGRGFGRGYGRRPHESQRCVRQGLRPELLVVLCVVPRGRGSLQRVPEASTSARSLAYAYERGGVEVHSCDLQLVPEAFERRDTELLMYFPQSLPPPSAPPPDHTSQPAPCQCISRASLARSGGGGGGSVCVRGGGGGKGVRVCLIVCGKFCALLRAKVPSIIGREASTEAKA